MSTRRIQQLQVFALLLATIALTVPLAGAVLYGGTAPSKAFLFIGAVSQSDFVPVLMLVGALALLVTSTDASGERTPWAVFFVAAVLLAAGATLAVAYLGSAYHLRSGGPFGLDERGQSTGWSSARMATVASLVFTGLLCGAVTVHSARWIGEQKRKMRDVS